MSKSAYMPFLAEELAEKTEQKTCYYIPHTYIVTLGTIGDPKNFFEFCVIVQTKICIGSKNKLKRWEFNLVLQTVDIFSHDSFFCKLFFTVDLT